jgi:hypothetical protein
MRRWVEDRFADGLSCHLKTCFWVAGQKERAGGLGTRSIQTILVALLMLLVSSTPALAQTPQPMPPGPPQNPLRPVLAPVGQADENWSFLRNPANRTDLWDPLKYIPLDSSGNYYLTFWFEDRSEYEWFQNENWGQGLQTISGYWLQRDSSGRSCLWEAYSGVFLFSIRERDGQQRWSLTGHRRGPGRFP